MNERLVVRIPLDVAQFEIDKEAIEDLVRDHLEHFTPLFERLVDVDDSRETFAEDTLEVDHVELNDGGGLVGVTFMSSFYSGCKDMASNDYHEANLPFTINGKELVFDIQLPPVWRTDD